MSSSQPLPSTPPSAADAEATPQPEAAQPPQKAEEETSFARLLEQYSADTPASGPKTGDRLEGVVVNLTADAALVDIGAKAEGFIPIEQLRTPENGISVQPGDRLPVIVEGRDAEGSLRLSVLHPDRPRNFEDLRLAHEEGRLVTGKVMGLGKGGLSVKFGEGRGFLPAARSGAHNQEEMHALVGQEVRARIMRLEPARNSVVLDRRSVLEEQRLAAENAALERLHEGDEIDARVASLAHYGAFVDLGGIEALLHVSDMSWQHLDNPATLVAIGDTVRVRVLKIEPQKRRISVGIKQLGRDPWEDVPNKYAVGQRVRGKVMRTTDFGAFIEVEPGVEGLIHISEMSWSRKQPRPSDIVKPGEVVEAVVLGVKPEERRFSLGLKQALGDPWQEAEKQYAPGKIVEGKVRNLQPFGAFVELAEGVDGMIHIGDLSEQRLKHPSEAVKVGDQVRVQVLEFDRAKRRIRLGMKQLAPKPVDLYIAAHQTGEVVSGRVVRAYPGRVQLDDGVDANCPSAVKPKPKIEEGTLAAKLSAVWKRPGAEPQPEAPAGVQLKAGETRKFRLTKLDAEQRAVEVEPV